MKKETNPYTQMNLAIRALAGGYLIYTAWKLRESLTEQPLLVIAMAAFAVIGAVLLIHAGWKLCKGQYEGGPGMANEETTEDEEKPVT